MINFKSIPFFKILFPFVLGIICVGYTGMFSNLHIVFLSLIAVWLIAFLFQKFYVTPFGLKKVLYIIITNALLFLLAFEASYIYNAKNNYAHYSHYVTTNEQSFTATICDMPVITTKFTKILVEINAIKQANTWHYAEGKSIVYLINDSTQSFKLGNQILVNSKFSYVNSPKNPFEFDYKLFLQNKNVFHVVYANFKNTHLICNSNQVFSFTQMGIYIKAYLVSVLRNSGLSANAFSISSALLVGYDDEIDSEVMQSFSHSGTLHILSVSGMHTGVLYTILIFVFSFFDKHDKYKKTKFCFIMVFLVLFIFITGLSPSVLRAALMLSLILFGKTFYKQGNSYNTLLLSAFLLLLYNPCLLQDVGFLLSYFAVGGIMYLYPILSKLYVFENKVLQWCWSMSLISVAATIFTLPISLFYFHQFPIWFVFSNLVIIPISMAIMLFAAAFLVVSKIAVLNVVMVFLINQLTTLMLWLTKLTDSTQYGFIDFIPFSKIDVVYLSLIIVLCLIIFSQKNYKHIIALCVVVIIWLSSAIYNSYYQKNNNQLIVFHVKQRSVFALKLGHTVYADFSNITQNEFHRHVKPYLLTISNLQLLPTKSNFFKVNNTSIIKLSKSGTIVPYNNANYVIISNDAPLQLTTNYKSKPFVIADCSNSYKFVKQLKKKCALLEIPFYWVKENGAIQITL